MEMKRCLLCTTFSFTRLKTFDLHLQTEHNISSEKEDYAAIINVHFLKTEELINIKNNVKIRIESFNQLQEPKEHKYNVPRNNTMDLRSEIEKILNDSDDEDDPDDPPTVAEEAEKSRESSAVSQIQRRLFDELGSSSEEECEEEEEARTETANKTRSSKRRLSPSKVVVNVKRYKLSDTLREALLEEPDDEYVEYNEKDPLNNENVAPVHVKQEPGMDNNKEEEDNPPLDEKDINKMNCFLSVILIFYMIL